MRKLLALYYIAIVFIVGGTFISTLWTKTMGVQQSSSRTAVQQEVFALEQQNQNLDRQLSDIQALSTTSIPEGFEPIKGTVALTQAGSLLATR